MEKARGPQPHAISLCNLCVLCVSVVIGMRDTTTTETPRTQRLHREKLLGLGRYPISLAFVFACVMLASCPDAFALNPNLDVSQYAHMSWKSRDGFPKGEISSIAQTPDGYLWLGTELGLFRFDGVRNVLWRPPANQELPSNFIFSLLVSRDGTLWIGTGNGLASWKDGRLTNYAE